MRTTVVSLLICAALCGCAKAQSPVEIADGRRDEAPADLSAWAARPPLRQAGAAARAYWRAKDAAYEEDFRVFAVAEGAFTRPGAVQQAVLYVMSLWPRCCPKMGLAVVEDGKLVRNVAFETVAEGLSAVPDLDGDGHDELVLTGSFGMGGQETRTMTLAAFGAAGLVERGGASIFDSTCATGMDGSSSTAARILALPGPTFVVERYARATCEAATWDAAGDAEPLELYASENAYVDLQVQ